MKRTYFIFCFCLMAIGSQAQTALTFSGTGEQYVQIDSIASLDFHFEEEFTLEAWTKQETLGNYPTLISIFDGIGIPDASGYWLGVSSAGVVGFQVFDSSGIFYNLNGTTKINDSTWHHIAGVYKNDSMFVYVDGVIEGSSKGPAKPKYSGKPLWFGNDAHSDYLLGSIDNIRIWDTARTEAEILLYKDSCGYDLDKNLIGHWQLDYGRGDYIFDYTGNNHFGTLMQMDTINSWTEGVKCLYHTLDINKSSNIHGILTYPNPTKDNINIEFDKIQESFSVQVLSVTGQLLESKKFQNTNSVQFQMNQPKGIYFLEITDFNGKRVTRKILKE